MFPLHCVIVTMWLKEIFTLHQYLCLWVSLFKNEFGLYSFALWKLFQIPHHSMTCWYISMEKQMSSGYIFNINEGEHRTIHFWKANYNFSFNFHFSNGTYTLILCHRWDQSFCFYNQYLLGYSRSYHRKIWKFNKDIFHFV